MIRAASTPEERGERQRLDKELKVQEKAFEELSHQWVSEYAEKALRIQAEKWKHAESDRFIIHYYLPDIRDRLVREAEFYYFKIKQDLKLGEDVVPYKSHIFLFQDEALWRQFQANASVGGLAGVTIGHEFFCFYPKRKEADFSGTVAHEMTHLVFNRFFRGRPPLWLNEGFAEYQAHNAYWSLYDKRFSKINKDTRKVATLDFLEMAGWTAYPEDDGLVQALYVKSQLTVELLVEKGGMDRFVQFVESMIQNPGFEACFSRHYSEVFKTYEDFIKELQRKEKRL